MISKPHDCAHELREMDLRATPARVAIMRFLEMTAVPVDTYTIAAYLKNRQIATDPATVFRIVKAFVQKGIIIPIQFQEGKARYELASKDDHHHLICEHCGKIEDITDCSMSDFEKNIKKQKNFLVKRHSLEFFGLCQKCIDQPQKSL